jgi:nucleoid DNA-binding protein
VLWRARGNRLKFRDFGVFETKTTSARLVQNPRTEEKIHGPAKCRVVFQPGKLMRDTLAPKRKKAVTRKSLQLPQLAQ